MCEREQAAAEGACKGFEKMKVDELALARNTHTLTTGGVAGLAFDPPFQLCRKGYKVGISPSP